MRVLKEYDNVRIVRLLTENRHYDGTDGVRVVRVLEAGAESIRRGGATVALTGA